MGLDRARRLAWVLCVGIIASCTCGKQEGGTGGSGPLAGDEAQVGGGQGRRVALEITEAFTKGPGQPAPRTSFLSPGEQIEVVAFATVQGKTLEARLPPTTFIRQDEPDIVRQEYVDYGTAFQPSLTHVSVPKRALLNTGSYAFIVEEGEGELEKLLSQVQSEVNRILSDDVQEQRVGTRGLRPDTVVVSPGPPVLEAGPLGDTDPQGDDVCGGPVVNGACAGLILAGPNGIAETRANNRKVQVDVSKLVASAFRNPQRNRAIGSQSLNSRHTRGRALDLDPRALSVPGKDARQLMCVLEAAGDRVVGEGDSFTERGAATFLDCNDITADHVHIQR